MKLYLLRHGIAVDRDEWKGDDASRPLTDDGRKIMEREAKALAKLDIDPDVILTSPLLRAKQTAQILADRLGMESVEDERLAESFDSARLAEILKEHDDCKCIVLVGHEPNFSETIGALIGGGRIDLKKGGIARVDLDDPSTAKGELVWLAPPRTI